ncbi:hypothetical protein Godav_016494 [Gossypium davidsonii]|uniref:Uncharacterized protein n=1 Tax=Gossypium davidsonii TaxID=34287 RepID=A0A7J8RS93_GOSDV|nr:hypothetical protein [Gossypium davidsonii]
METDIQQCILVSYTRREPSWTSHWKVAPRNSRPGFSEN